MADYARTLLDAHLFALIEAGEFVEIDRYDEEI